MILDIPAPHVRLLLRVLRIGEEALRADQLTARSMPGGAAEVARLGADIDDLVELRATLNDCMRGRQQAAPALRPVNRQER